MLVLWRATKHERYLMRQLIAIVLFLACTACGWPSDGPARQAKQPEVVKDICEGRVLEVGFAPPKDKDPEDLRRFWPVNGVMVDAPGGPDVPPGKYLYFVKVIDHPDQNYPINIDYLVAYPDAPNCGDRVWDIYGDKAQGLVVTRKEIKFVTQKELDFFEENPPGSGQYIPLARKK
jgi:hypothetical protein